MNQLATRAFKTPKYYFSRKELIFGLKIVVIYDFLDEINKEKLIEFIVNLQQQDGSFSGDKWGSLFFSY